MLLDVADPQDASLLSAEWRDRAAPLNIPSLPSHRDVGGMMRARLDLGPPPAHYRGIIITQLRVVLGEDAVRVRGEAAHRGAQRRDGPVRPYKGDQLKVAHFQG